MDIRASTASPILIATDNLTDAALVKNLLTEEFGHVFITTDPEKVAEDYARHLPSVLVLAFNTLEKTKRYYLELCRLCEAVHQHPHRTVILCNMDEVRQVYDLCKKDFFDDYILFWPMTHDSTRLAMTIHHALRELAALKYDEPSAAEFAAQARYLAELEKTLDQQIIQGSHHIEWVKRAMDKAQQNIGTALDGFSRRIASGALQDMVEVKNSDGLEQEIGHFKRVEVQPHLIAATESTQHLERWVQEFRHECEPLLESTRVLNDMAGRVRPTVLVVDDDEAQRIIIGRLLAGENYDPLFARDGLEALNVLRTKRPDLILMDMMMPNMNGAETTRQLKAMPQFSRTPVIMITGKSEGKIVVDCMLAGAVDFVVKPFVHATLMDKIAHALNPTST
jgi:CheY-like chemotaxis protein